MKISINDVIAIVCLAVIFHVGGRALYTLTGSKWALVAADSAYFGATYSYALSRVVFSGKRDFILFQGAFILMLAVAVAQDFIMG